MQASLVSVHETDFPSSHGNVCMFHAPCLYRAQTLNHQLRSLSSYYDTMMDYHAQYCLNVTRQKVYDCDTRQVFIWCVDWRAGQAVVESLS
jgi:hypothetical protein